MPEKNCILCAPLSHNVKKWWERCVATSPADSQFNQAGSQVCVCHMWLWQQCNHCKETQMQNWTRNVKTHKEVHQCLVDRGLRATSRVTRARFLLSSRSGPLWDLRMPFNGLKWSSQWAEFKSAVWQFWFLKTKSVKKQTAMGVSVVPGVGLETKVCISNKWSEAKAVSNEVKLKLFKKSC